MSSDPFELAGKNPHRADEALSVLYTALGRAVAAWAHIEEWLSLWLFIAAAMEQAMAIDIFHSHQSFRGKLGLMRSALVHSKLPQDEKSFVESVLYKADLYSTFRNAMIHGACHVYAKTDGYYLALISGMHSTAKPTDTLDDAITVDHLCQAANNFDALVALMQHAHLARKLKGKTNRQYKSPAQFQQLVELPRTATQIPPPMATSNSST